MNSLSDDGSQPAAAQEAPEDDSHSLAADLRAPSISRAYQCQCGRPVFLGNTQCLACGTPLGFITEQLGVVPLSPAQQEGAEPETFTIFGDTGGKTWQRCANFKTVCGCNWMVPAPREGDDASLDPQGLAPGFCLSCSATRTIPDLSVEANGTLWRKLEQAKRRLLSQLLALGLPVVTRHADPVHGLAFDFLGDVPGGPRVLTGHDTGVITLNAEEAEDAVRERIRAEMREPYRTLLGHFRHEVGHHYWDVLVLPTPWLEDFRALFGDERADYSAALRTHYENGPPEDWAVRFVTSYASSHPWEDWAETWAHYLHMADTADTAMSFGVDAQNVELASDLFEPSDLWQPEHPGALKFLDFLNGWVRLTNVLNELSRSMGQPDYYPFVLPRAAVRKLQFIHQVITEQRQRSQTGAIQDEQTSTDVVLDPAADPATGVVSPVSSPQPEPLAAAAAPEPVAPALKAPALAQSSSQGQTQAQQPFFSTGTQQNQGPYPDAGR